MLGSLPVPSITNWISDNKLSSRVKSQKAAVRTERSSQKTADQVSPEAWTRINDHLARDRYRFDKGDDGRYYASHREQNLRFIFDINGLTVKPRNSDTGSNDLHLKFRQIGRDNALTDIGSPKIAADRYRLEYQYVDSGVTEWYLNGTTGLEQGFTLDHALPGEGLLNLTLTSNIAPQLTWNGSDAQWAINDVTYIYRNLKVIDATGRILPAHLKLVESKDALQIVVDDRDAAYPITIDPLITSQTLQLIAPDGSAGDQFGGAVAMSGDVIIIGAPNDQVGSNVNQGSVYVFSRNQGGGDNWGLVKRLNASDGSANRFFGRKIAINSDFIAVGISYSVYFFVRNGGGVDNWGEIKKISIPTSDVSISVSNDLIVVGGSETNGTRGSIFIYARNQGGADNWGIVKQLTPPDVVVNERFGETVAVNGDIIVAGSRWADIDIKENQGSAYVFARNQGGADNWGQVKKLVAPDGVAGDFFGSSVAVNNDMIVVGAPWDDVGTTENQGSVCVFRRNQGGLDNWGMVRQLTASDLSGNDLFGSSVAVTSNVIVVGASWDDVGTNGNQGSAYIFERNQGGQDNWGQVEHLIISDGAANDYFGGTVSISGNTIVVGAPQRKVGTNINQGSAYIFTRSGNDWVQVAHPVSAGGMSDDRFGSSVAMNNDLIVIGAPLDDVGAFEQGSAYIFARNQGGADNWGQLQHLIASDGRELDYFGTSVAINENIIVVGAPGKQVNLNGRFGSVYVFIRNEGGSDKWGEVQKLIVPESNVAPGAINDGFGQVVALSGDQILVGAPYYEFESKVYHGAAYLFTRSPNNIKSWSLLKKILPSDGNANDCFGRAVTIWGDAMVIAAGGYTVSSVSDLGSVYIYSRNLGGADQWGQVKKLSGQYFGFSVALFNDVLAVGARGSTSIFTRNLGGADKWGQVKQLMVSSECVALYGDVLVVGGYQDNIGKRSAYIFSRNMGGADNWGQIKQLTSPGDIAFDNFGESLAISGDVIVIGASFRNVGAHAQQGSTFIFTRNQGGADNWGQLKERTASGGAAGDQFGYSVAISGDVLIVGAPYDDIGANVDQGSAYIFSRNQGQEDGWESVQQLIASNGGAYDNFGYSVSLNGNVAVVGAPKDDNGLIADQGSAYVFARNKGGMNKWGQLKVLSAVDGGGNDQFGFSVSVSGDVIVVGARLKDVGTNTDQGSAYVFSRNIGGADNWGQVKQLTASDGARSDQFGYSVAVDGDVVAVGALADDIGTNSNQGSAYVFTRNQGGADNWGQIKQLIASDGAANDQFGFAVAVNGDVIVVGAALDDVGVNTDQGSAYVFTRNQGGADNWGQVVQLKATNGTAGDKFGISVGVSNDVIVVGATATDISGKVDQGSAYIFARNQGGADTWGQFEQLIASDGAANDLFGNAVAISGNVIVVGARADNVGANGDEGSVYIFMLANSA